MVNPSEYDRYNTPLAEQMQRIAIVGPRFLGAIHDAQSSTSGDFIMSAMTLHEELSGKPGDGALEVYRDLDSNLKHVLIFISQWQADSNPYIKRAVAISREIYQELQNMRTLVSDTPPHIMDEIKKRLTIMRYGRNFPSTTLLIIIFAVILILRHCHGG